MAVCREGTLPHAQDSQPRASAQLQNRQAPVLVRSNSSRCGETRSDNFGAGQGCQVWARVYGFPQFGLWGWTQLLRSDATRGSRATRRYFGLAELPRESANGETRCSSGG